MILPMKRFYYLHVNFLLTLAVFILLNLSGGVFPRLDYRSIHAVKFLIKLGVFYLGGNTLAFLIRKFFKITDTSDKKPASAPLILVRFSCFISVFALVISMWLRNTFPLWDSQRVFYTAIKLFQGGGVGNVGYLISGILLLLLSAVISFFILRAFKIVNKKKLILQIKNIHINFNMFYPVLCVLSLITLTFALYYNLYIDGIVKIYKKYPAGPIDSDFYAREYCVPKNENITFPEKKKNLIFIFAESMETSFMDKASGGLLKKNLIPNLSEVAKDNINFSHNGGVGGSEELVGTNWTVASMLAHFAGLPYNQIEIRNQGRRKFLPNAILLTDILHDNGYKSLFLMGSDKAFAGRDALLETHGDVEIHDLFWYRENNFLPTKDYNVFWGFEDKKLFDFAKRELDTLPGEAPFFLGMITVDTHGPAGYICEDCPTTEDMDIKNAILCSDKKISDFLHWCAEQSWYDDTVIVIVGDHLFMDSPATTPFTDGAKEPRNCINIFINSCQEKLGDTNRRFSSLDMFPTILGAMGCTIKDNKLGFGVNLFSDERTLLERYPKDYINTELTTFNKQYMYLEDVSVF